MKQDSSRLSYLEFMASLDLASLHPGGRKAKEELLSHLNIDSADTVLDVGCGSGRDLVSLARRYNCKAIGVDYSEKMVEIAKRRVDANGLGDRVTVKKADAHDLPFNDGEFDIVYTQSVLLQLDKDKAVREFSRVLKQDGHLGSLEFAWEDEVDEELLARIQELTGEHFSPLNHNGWRDLFTRSGLREHHVSFSKKNVAPSTFRDLVAAEDWMIAVKGLVNVLRLPPDLRLRMRKETQYLRWIKENGKLGYGIYCYRGE
ncbi:MAG: class I SAM-dependent methyltransferase [Thaumarchaeota archaeon]|nr:class I SAM-dependent methyltransferase [Nitrososphaerota archaeon]